MNWILAKYKNRRYKTQRVLQSADKNLRMYGGIGMKRITAIIIFCFMMFLGITAGAATYYVSNSGNDTKDGLSENSAWRTLEKVNQQVFSPGDIVLFEAGGIWNGSLWVRGSGNEKNSITVGKYGNGSKPVINGNGSNAAIFLYNQQYVEITDLEITNRGEEAWRYGVYVCGYDAGALKGIKIRNLTVHDVNGMFSKKIQGIDNHWNGGILVSARGSIATRFVGLEISNCEVYDVARTGICTISNFWTSFDKKLVGMSQELKITNNSVHNIKGDGIIVCGDYNGEIKSNTVYETNNMSYYDKINSANVGIFTLHCTDTVVSENESYLSRTIYDGFGYDIDGDCDGVIFQYNYSHDNEGGFLMLVNHNNYGAVARYNISQNDKRQSICVANPTTNAELLKMTAQVYNNTIYGEPNEDYMMLNLNSGTESLFIANNIFYLVEPKGLFDDVYNNIASTSGLEMTNNIYYGNNSVTTLGKYDKFPIYSNPLLAGAGTGAAGRNTLGGYELQQNSPAKNTGALISDNGGYDFYGNTVSSTEPSNIGACNK